MREIQHHELAGHNYCRNPDNTQPKPWCYVDKMKTIEFCDIKKCSERLWLFVIIGLIGFSTFIVIIIILVCCRKFRKQGVSNIQNVRLLIIIQYFPS